MPVAASLADARPAPALEVMHPGFAQNPGHALRRGRAPKASRIGTIA
jgi:hypothetical protein